MNKKTIVIFAVAAFLGGAAILFRRPAAGHGSPATAATEKAKYQCSMHPQIVSDKPGNCPICGMKLVLVQGGQTEGTDGGEVPGHAPFSLSTQRQQLIGVRTGPVQRRDLNQEIRTVGQVAYDPDLYNALAEYREALAARGKLSGTSSPDARGRVDALIRSSALRLKIMGVAQDQIAGMLSEKAGAEDLLLPGKRVWVYAQVYEYESDLIHAGQNVTVTAPSARGREYSGRVAGVDAVLNAATRTLRVRVEIAAPQGRLKPEAFVNVKIQVPMGAAIAVPEEAVLDTGERQIVFVKEGDGRFEPRAVELGREAQGFYEVLSGLSEGEEVVTSANFLIDSESRFRSAVSAFSNKDGGKP